MPKPLLIAHRGDPSHALENSLEAVRRALSIPADMIEIDIRKSRDNCLYVMHDERTGRTCDRDLTVEDSLSDDISKIRLKNGEPVPTLTDVLGLVAGRAGLNVEIKSDGAGALTAAHIVGSGYQGDVVISSFKDREVADARRVMPAALAGGIFDDFALADLATYRSRGYGLISLRRRAVTRELVAACHDRKIKVFVWTVDDEAEMRKFIEWGVDGIYSNRPAVLRKVMYS
jgi:glycerophosphoryl diester phosphodiesterase